VKISLGTRLWLAFATVFWLAMMFLLWRSEFGGSRRLASSVPPAMVWKKMLTAPDQSTLDIRMGTNHLGYCHWRPDIGQERATGAQSLDEDENPIEGMVPQLAYYIRDARPIAARRLRSVGQFGGTDRPRARRCRRGSV
jgi:hypothetical protein